MVCSTVAYRVAATPAARAVSRLVNGALCPSFRRLDDLQQVIAAYPQLKPEDIRAALAYAAEVARERIVPVPSAAAE